MNKIKEIRSDRKVAPDITIGGRKVNIDIITNKIPKKTTFASSSFAVILRS